MHRSGFFQPVFLKENGNWALYNFANREVILLTPAEMAAFEAYPEGEISPPLFRKLTEGGFLTEADEIRMLRDRCSARVHEEKSDSVALTVCPTMDCNFACPYCVETGQKRSGRMTPETVYYLKRFYDRLLEESQARFATVDWYGGEPTLAVDIIEDLSTHFLRTAHLLGVEYASSITTNGYLLDENAVKRLDRAGIFGYRITVDGTAETHDSVRMLTGGQGTYRRIMENIRRMCESGHTIEVRCNVSRRNASSVAALNDEITRLREETGASIHLRCARMMVYRDVPQEMKQDAMTEAEFSDFWSGIYSFYDGSDMLPLNVPCRACLKYSYCIDECGDIFKCNSFLGKKEHSLGNVSALPRAEELAQGSDSVFIREHAFPTAKECLTCKMLPICLGSCPLSSEKRCHRLKQHPEVAALLAAKQLCTLKE